VRKEIFELLQKSLDNKNQMLHNLVSLLMTHNGVTAAREKKR